ncbi:MAG: UDP-N-acetylmuramate--L-alanine ligase [Bacteroidales bacterium]
MDLNKIHNIFFLGIGGIGMSALARFFHARGASVSGYDKTPTSLTHALHQQGMQVFYQDNPEVIPADCQLVIYTPAVPATTRLFQAIEAQGLPLIKRARILGIISEKIPTIAVAGTHGKTTITTMIAHIMRTAGMNFSAFLGGISANYNTNFLGSIAPDWMVVEADEYDRSFLQLAPQIAVISSMDADHLDIYGSTESMLDSFSLFAQKVHPEGLLILKQGLKLNQQIQAPVRDYHISHPAAHYAENIQVKNNTNQAQIKGLAPVEELVMGLAGKHNLENALAAIAVCHHIGIDTHTIARALASFKGVKRRFETIYHDDCRIFIDDYAHHPEELKASLNSARELFPGRKITAIFQPHLFSRTRDLAAGFVQSLSLADELILMEIYPAREAPIPGITSQWLLQQIPLDQKSLMTGEEVLETFIHRDIEVLLTLGAGNIDLLVEPLQKILQKKGQQ